MKRIVVGIALLVLVLGAVCTTSAQGPTAGGRPDTAWAQIALPPGCPDWTRFDMEYYPGTGLAYILGGRSGTVTDGTIYSFDPAARVCAATGTAMPVAIYHYTIAPVWNGSQNLLCTFGGRDSTGAYTAYVQCFDPVTNTANIAGALPGDLGYYLDGGVVVVDNVVYIFGGYRNSFEPFNTAETWAWDPVTNSWTQKGDLGLARGFVDTAVVDGRVYGFGGDIYDGTNLVAQTYAEVFDPAAGVWTTLSPLPIASGEGRAFGFDTGSGYELAGKVLIAGGGQWPGDGSEVETYDIATDAYDYSFADLNVPRRNQASFFVPGNPGAMWVFGGYSSAPGYGGDNPPYSPPEYHLVEALGMHLGSVTGYFGLDPYGRTRLVVLVQAHDAGHNPLGQVQVDASITWPTGGPVSRTRLTKPTGWARFHWGANATGTWTLCVSNLARSGYLYVPGSNDVPSCTSWSN